MSEPFDESTQPEQKQQPEETTVDMSETSSVTTDRKPLDRARDAYASRDVAAAKAAHRDRVHHMESHGGSGSDYIKSIVFGGLDGIITTFAIISAAAGAGADYKTVLIFGFANVLADAFSMGFGECVSGNAERDVAMNERAREEWEVENCFESEVAEMEALYEAKGLSKEDAQAMVAIISKDPKIFVDFMMVDELEILCDLDDKWGPYKQGVVMFCSFIFFGMIPVYAYLSGKGKGTDWVFGLSCGLTAAALMVLGSIKGILTNMNVPLAATLMLFNGAVSGGVSFGVGVLVEYIVESSS